MTYQAKTKDEVLNQRLMANVSFEYPAVEIEILSIMQEWMIM